MNPSEIRAQIDLFYIEIATTADGGALTVHDLPYIDAVMARWQSIGDEVAQLNLAMKGLHLKSKMHYEALYRDAVKNTGTLTVAATGDERTARIQAKYHKEFREFQAYTFIIEMLDDFKWNLKRRLDWLNGLLISARELDKRAFYASSKDTFLKG